VANEKLVSLLGVTLSTVAVHSGARRSRQTPVYLEIILDKKPHMSCRSAPAPLSCDGDWYTGDESASALMWEDAP